MSAAPSAPRSSATPTWPWPCSPARPSAAGRSSGSRAGARTTSSTIHGRDHITYLEIAGKRDGEITGLRVKTYANLGGRLSTIGPGIPTTLYARVLSGCYKIPNVFCEVTGVYTNTTFVDAYRGAGRPEATYVIERAMDLFAAEIGMDRAEIRRRNFIPPDAVPVREPVRPRDRLGRREDLHRLRELRAGDGQGARDGRLRRPGRQARPRRRPAASSSALGLSTYIEVCGVAPSKWIGAVGEGWGAAMWESSNIKVHLTGKVVVTIGTQPQGQGHETTYAQVVAHELGIPMDDVDRPALRHPGHAVRLRLVRQPDLVGRDDRGDQGGRARSRPRPRRYAAHMLEANLEDIEIDGAEYRVKGSPDKKKTIQEIAFALDLAFDAPEGMEPYLDETAYYDTPNCTWPFGTHIAIVEIDEETGDVDLVRYVAVDDVGKKINPMIVDGQLHGGIAQGVGQALWERRRLRRRRPAPVGLHARLRAAAGVVAPARSSSTRRSPRRRSTRSASRASARPARSPARRRSPTPSSMRSAPLGIRHLDMPYTRPEGLAGDAGGEGRPGMIPAAFDYQRPTTLDEALARSPAPTGRPRSSPAARASCR